MINLLADIFQKRQHFWNLKGGRRVVPGEKELTEALDHAAKELYDEATGAILEMGGLFIEKRDIGLDVYVYVGNYTKEKI